ncbi:MAG TPA: hypothetical protein VFW16_16415 [Streptosporangiaceae bacterium]|nr:hypothetical protein [Streptosporangiaceae bacterium]
MTTSGGAGLGLAIARSVAVVHGAVVTARSRPTGGLDVEVTLAATARGTSDESSATSRPRGPERLMTGMPGGLD